MFLTRQILAIACALGLCEAGLTGCGQKGPLFIPTEAAAANRATLPQTLRPFGSPAPAPAAPASAPR